MKQEVGGWSGSILPGSPAQGCILRVGAWHWIGGTGVIEGGGGGRAGQVHRCPQHQVPYVTDWVENLQGEQIAAVIVQI